MGSSQSKPDDPSILEKLKTYLEMKRKKSIYPSPDSQVIKTTSKKPIKPAPQSALLLASNAEPTPTLKREPAEETNENIIELDDRRTRIDTTDQWPYSVHGVIICEILGRPLYGTGIMIGPNVVLTAGHNLYHDVLKVSADLQSIRFLPGADGERRPFGSVKVDNYFVSPNYRENGKEDYAILILKEPIGEMTGYFGLACLEPAKIKDKKINITGYPANKVTGRPNTYEMWGMEGSVYNIDEEKGLINYLIDTTKGQSGSGVWYQEGEDYYACGVHKAGDFSINRATLLTRNAYRQIHEWLSKMNSPQFLFTPQDIEELNLHNQRVNESYVSFLLGSNLENLRILSLSFSGIGDEEVKMLAKNTSWVNLSELSFYMNRIGEEGAKALSQNTSWTKLEKLDLYENYIGAEGAKELAKNTSWVKLSLLNLWKNYIGDEGAKGLAQNTSWVMLEDLNLGMNDISSEGARELAKNTSWAKLSKLDLHWNSIGTIGIGFLQQNKAWKKYIEIDCEEMRND